MACLLITTGEQAGTYFPLSKRPLTAGRDPAREIQIVDPEVSRKHFLIRMDGDGYVILDMKSRNGVFVNAEKVTEHRLADGDRIQAGDTELTFHEANDPDRTNALLHYHCADRHLREDRTLGE